MITKPNKLAGLTLILFSISFAVLLFFELQRPDGDNPFLSLDFIASHPDIFTLTGLAYIAMSITLVVGLLALRESEPEPKLLAKIGYFFGFFAAAFILVQGSLRMAGDTLLYMAGLDREFGFSAYLAVQMIGTQGLALAGGFGLDVFAGAFGLSNLRNTRMPRLLSLLGLLGFLNLGLGIFGKLFSSEFEDLYIFYLASFVLVPVWIGGLGIWNLQKRS